MAENQDVLLQLIEKSGSMKALGVLLGNLARHEALTEQRIQNWKDRGVPVAWRYWVVQLAKQNGIDIAEAAFIRGEAA